MGRCEPPGKRSASEALPSWVSIRSSLSTRPQGSPARRSVSSSLRRFSSFPAASSSSRAASHSLRVPVMCFVIALLSTLHVHDRTASPVPPSSLPWMPSPYRSACNPHCSVPKRSRGPGSSPQSFDLLGQDAGEVLPALLVAAAHLIVGEPVVRQHQVGGAAGRRHLDGHPGLEPARPFRHPRELQQPRALHAQVAAVVRPQTAGMVRLPIPKLVDRGLAENGPVRLEPAPEAVGGGPRVEDLFGRSFDPAGDRDPEEGGGRARSGSRHRQSLFLFALRNASSLSRRAVPKRPVPGGPP